jgi:hypothetical protein
MTERHSEENVRAKGQQGWNHAESQVRQAKNDGLDLELDAVLRQYAAVEPRAGLEERLLANLRAECERATVQVWWRWSAAGAVAAVVLMLALFLSWRSRESQVSKTVGPNATEASREVPNSKLANSHLPSQPVASVRPAVANRSRHSSAVVKSAPRVEQFPSPRPLSEQEEILAGYVATYPEHATLVARARSEALRRDAIEELRDPAGEENSQP